MVSTVFPIEPCRELTQRTGAPIDLDPTVDNPADGKDPNRANDFDYSNDLTAQTKCPFTAHLRKVSFIYH